MKNRLNILQDIAEILNPKNNNLQIRSAILESKYNWENIVSVGSKHLMLPAIYYRLRDKNLLPYIPDDLHAHLEHIAFLNSERNNRLLSQIESIGELFDSGKISHVFLKGAALIKLGLYKHVGERMIGDIDILVDPKSIKQAYQLLLDNNYEILDATPGDLFLNPKHWSPLVPKNEDHIFAVELHSRFFEAYSNQELLVSDILKQKQVVTKISIPSNQHLLLHTILNWQINDKGLLFKTFSFRSTHDAVLLFQNDSGLKKIPSLLKRPFRSYLQIGSIIFEDGLLPSVKTKTLNSTLFLWITQHTLFAKSWFVMIKFLFLVSFFFRKLVLAFKNPKYFSSLFSDLQGAWSKLKKLFI